MRVQRRAERAVGAEHDRADARPSPSAPSTHRAGAVAEQRAARLPVVGVGEAREDLGADHQHAVGAAGLDLAGGELQRGEEAGAGGADVEGAGALGAERVGDHGRGVRDESSGLIVATSTRSTSSGSTPASASARLAANDRQVGQALVVGAARRRVVDAGALHDPLVVDADARGDRRVGDDSVGHAWPRPVIAARCGAGGVPLRVASRAIVARSDGSVALRMGELLGGARPCVSGRMRLPSLASTLPGPTSTKRSAPASCRASIVSRQRTGAVSAVGELLADVLERPRGRAGDDGDARLVRARRRRARRGTAATARLHRGRVEGAGDVERQRAHARARGRSRAASASASRAPERTTWPGALSLATVTPAVSAISLRLVLGGAEQGEHRAAVGGLGHQLAAQDDEAQRVVALEHAGGGERGRARRASGRRRRRAARGVERVPAGEAGAEDRGLREAGALPAAGTGPRRRARCTRSSRSGARPATRSRMSGSGCPVRGTGRPGPGCR